jgi:soluble lytic murein transglycosylase-like protein
MTRFYQALSAFSAGCGKLPLCVGILLLLTARLVPNMADVPPPAASASWTSSLPADFRIIDEVLSRRAPDLGFALRSQLALSISEEARQANYDPLLILAIIDVESDFIDEAVSTKGARGLMQIRPSTLHFLTTQSGLRLTRQEVASDPSLQVRMGIRYLRQLHDRFGSLDLALMAYNAGPTRLRRALRSGKLEPFQRYTELVKRDFKRFREGMGLGGDWMLAQREAR